MKNVYAKFMNNRLKQLIMLLLALIFFSVSCDKEKPPINNSDAFYGTVSGSFCGHDYVDLCLPSGTMWATCNIGATAPEEYGDNYAWGETSIKSNYDLGTYQFFSSNYHNIGSDIAGARLYDAAYANWGYGWSIPTKEQFDELLANCTWKWRNINGVQGYEVKGVNDNSIFMPCSGYQYGYSSLNEGTHGFYWSSNSGSSEIGDAAYGLYFYNDCQMTTNFFRCRGMKIRPVRKEY